MRLRSQVQDALYLNWALPVAALPPLPEPLRYQTFPADAEEGAGEGRVARDGSASGRREMAFASALLFRHRGVHLPQFPFVRFSYPQLNLRLYTLDADRVPSVLFVDMLMPWWVGPAVRLVADGSASAARFSYPRPSADPTAAEWSWRVDQRGGALDVLGRRGSGMALTASTSVGTWKETVRFFRERPRGYVLTGGRLRRVEAEHPPVEVWPMTVEVGEDSLLRRVLPLGAANGHGEAPWPDLHSAWLCPEIPFVFELGIVPGWERDSELDSTLAQPASTRSTCTRSSTRAAL